MIFFSSEVTKLLKTHKHLKITKDFHLIWSEFHQIDQFKLTELSNYLKDFNAFFNGYQNTKSFKLLSKIKQRNPEFHLDFINQYALGCLRQQRIKHLNSFDDLLQSATHHSAFAYFMMVITKHVENVDLFSTLSVFEYLSGLLLNFQSLKQNHQFSFPELMVFDYNITFSIDGYYMVNQNFIFLWETIHQKVRLYHDETLALLDGCYDVTKALITSYLALVSHLLETFRKNNYQSK